MQPTCEYKTMVLEVVRLGRRTTVSRVRGDYIQDGRAPTGTTVIRYDHAGVVRLERHECVSWCVRRLLPGRSCTVRNNCHNQVRAEIRDMVKPNPKYNGKEQRPVPRKGSRSNKDRLEAKIDPASVCLICLKVCNLWLIR